MNNIVPPIREGIFSYFNKPITNTKLKKQVTLKEIYDYTTSETAAEITAQARNINIQEEYSQFKASQFDYVVFTGVFNKRKDKDCQSYSGLFAIDIDHLDENTEELRRQLIKDDTLSPRLIFKSPSGNGLKIVVAIDPAIIDFSSKGKKMNNLWQALNTYFSKHYNNLIMPNEKNQYIDDACTDLSRACFLCHDPECFFSDINVMILGQEFIDSYPSIEKTTKHINFNEKQTLRVNPATTLEDLAERHLLIENNHHGELIAFICAAKNIGFTQNRIFNFIESNISISPESSHSVSAKLRATIDDLYKRYGNQTKDVIPLTPLSFAFDFLYFKYSKDAKQFILTSLYINQVRKILHKADYGKRAAGKGFLYVQVVNNVIKEVSPENMCDFFIEYVRSIKENVCFSYQEKSYEIPPAAIQETFLRNSYNIFNQKWLQQLQILNKPILKDTESEMFFCFKNTLVVVSKSGIKTRNWNDQDKFCIWENQIIKHDFKYIPTNNKAHFYEFLQNVCNNDPTRFSSLQTMIGYLLHNYFKESEGQAGIFYDESITNTNTPMGGTGKGLIMNAIKQMRKVCKIDGKHLDVSNKFRFEMLEPGVQITWLDDVRPNFDFSMLHSNLTDGWTIERKHCPQFFIEPKDSPKTVITSNVIIKGNGSTNTRRQHVFALGNFYSKQIINGDEKPIEKTHGCLFFSDQWNKDEWNMFFSVMLDACCKYLECGVISYKNENVRINKLRQSTNEEFADWIEQQNYELNKFYKTKDEFKNFINVSYGNTSPSFAQRTFTNYLQEFAIYKGWEIEIKPSNGISRFIFKNLSS